MKLTRRIKDALKKQLAHAFHLGQRCGIDILPRHFYSEIPEMQRLRATDPWRKPYSMIGVQGWNVDEQLQYAQGVLNEETRRSLASQDVYEAACAANGAIGYTPSDAQFLYGFVRRHRPQRIMQVGSGVSTAISLSAAQTDGYEPKIICIDPYPTRFLIDQDRAGRIQLVPSPVEELEPAILDNLMSGDLFFVDSTHTLGPAGEVTRIVLDMLPTLRPGVIVHFHDIWFPYDFDPRIMDRIFFWHESALLHAFLCGNPRFRVLCSLSLLHHERQQALGQLIARYTPMQIERGVRVRHGDFPSSIYLQVTG